MLYFARVEGTLDTSEDVGRPDVPEHRVLHPVEVLRDQVRAGKSPTAQHSLVASKLLGSVAEHNTQERLCQASFFRAS